MEEHKARTSYLMLQQVKSAKPMSTYFSYLCNVRGFLILPDKDFTMVKTLILYSQIDNSRYIIRESVSDKTCSVSRGTCSDDHQICLGEYVFGISRLPLSFLNGIICTFFFIHRSMQFVFNYLEKSIKVHPYAISLKGIPC